MTAIRLDQLTRPDYLALFEQVFSSVDEVCSALEPGEWDLPTDCPAWTVKDQLSHLASYEGIAAGLAEVAADVDVSHLPHVGPDDAFHLPNEREVERRRTLPAGVILEELRDAVAARLKHFASLDEAGWDADVSRFPWGEVGTKDAMPIRILDAFYHEQDIRRAADRPGHLAGDVSRFVFERMATFALPRIVAKQAGAPDGSVVVFDVGPPGRAVAVRTEGGRGTAVEPAAGEPTIRLAMDLEAFFCLLGGRRTPEQLGARLRVEGDQDLARRILEHVDVVP